MSDFPMFSAEVMADLSAVVEECTMPEYCPASRALHETLPCLSGLFNRGAKELDHPLLTGLCNVAEGGRKAHDARVNHIERWLRSIWGSFSELAKADDLLSPHGFFVRRTLFGIVAEGVLGPVQVKSARYGQEVECPIWHECVPRRQQNRGVLWTRAIQEAVLHFLRTFVQTHLNCIDTPDVADLLHLYDFGDSAKPHYRHNTVTLATAIQVLTLQDLRMTKPYGGEFVKELGPDVLAFQEMLRMILGVESREQHPRCPQVGNNHAWSLKWHEIPMSLGCRSAIGHALIALEYAYKKWAEFWLDAWCGKWATPKYYGGWDRWGHFPEMDATGIPFEVQILVQDVLGRQAVLDALNAALLKHRGVDYHKARALAFKGEWSATWGEGPNPEPSGFDTNA